MKKTGIFGMQEDEKTETFDKQQHEEDRNIQQTGRRRRQEHSAGRNTNKTGTFGWQEH
jgi:hypothetical protein